MTAGAALVGTTWVHVFEQDGPDGAVYRPDDGQVPRSRRPRERVVFSRDGSARLLLPGPDDRLREVGARWAEVDGEITVTPDAAAASSRTLRARRAPDGSLVVR